MSSIDNSHLAPDVLEDAALGHLTSDRLAAVEAHCTVCTSCREAYNNERRIVAGIRSAGRSALKQRLAAAGSTRTGTPWVRITAIAATLVVLVGTGILYRWLSRQPETPQVITETPASDASPSPAEQTARPDADRKSRASAPPPAASRAKKEINQDRRPDLPSQREMEETRTLNSDLADQREARGSGDLARRPAPAAAAPAKEAAPTIVAAEKHDEQELVLWGVPAAQQEQTKDKTVVSGGAAQTHALGPRNAQRQEAMTSILTAHPSHTYVIQQQIVLAMPRRNAMDRPDAVPARIVSRGDTIIVVLLMHHLLPEGTIRSAVVQECPPDSFQLVLPGTRLGFKAPAGFLRSTK